MIVRLSISIFVTFIVTTWIAVPLHELSHYVAAKIVDLKTEGIIIWLDNGIFEGNVPLSLNQEHTEIWRYLFSHGGPTIFLYLPASILFWALFIIKGRSNIFLLFFAAIGFHGGIIIVTEYMCYIRDSDTCLKFIFDILFLLERCKKEGGDFYYITMNGVSAKAVISLCIFLYSTYLLALYSYVGKKKAT